MVKNFDWAPYSNLPRIEEHTKRKLDVLKDYLDVYFDTLVPNPAQDRLNITLVDGFSGGGAYSDGAETRVGSPLVMLNAVSQAEVRLNEKREKPLKIKARFIFVDSKREHVAALRSELDGRGYRGDPRITILDGTFVDHLPAIIRRISEKQRSGRSIFFLDQFGYSDVPMSSIRTVFESLGRAEVVLNFAIDALLNYLHDGLIGLERFRQFEIDDRFIADWNQNKTTNMGRALTQRALMANIWKRSGAKFFTPFLLRSPTDNRTMMLAHLSQHQAARDKMLKIHWQAQNYFVHVGDGGLFNLGYDARLIESCSSLFDFTEIERSKLNEELHNALPREVWRIMSGGQLNVSDLLTEIGNRTAGTNDDIFRVISELAQAKELEVLSVKGKPKRFGTKISVKDKLILPKQSSLFSLIKR